MPLKTKATFWKQRFLCSLETHGEQFFYGMCVIDFNNLMSGAGTIILRTTVFYFICFPALYVTTLMWIACAFCIGINSIKLFFLKYCCRMHGDESMYLFADI